MILWHNPRCSKSRQALALLEENGYAPTVRLYLKDAPSEAEIREVLRKLGCSAIDMMRSKDAAFKELGLDPTDQDALINAMVQNSALIERPIAITEKYAKIGRPPENVLALIQDVST